MKKVISILALMACLSASAFATDVTIASPQLGPIPFQPTNIGTDRTYNATVTNGSTTVAISGTLPTNVIGRAGFQVSINGGLYPVAGIPNANSLTLTIPYPGTTGSVSLIFYKFVLLRIGVSAQFTTPEGDVIPSGNIQSGFFFKEVAISIINSGSGNLAYFPSMTLPATTNSTTNPSAKYSAGFFRADGSFIVNYGCFTSFSLPPTGITTWSAICSYNAAPFVPLPNAYITVDQLNARLPSGTTNQLVYFAAPGNILSPLTLGTNLSISAGRLNASGGGGGGGGNLASLNGLTAADQTFSVFASDPNLSLTVTSAGANHQFAVTRIGTFPTTALPPQVVYTNTGNTYTSGTRQDFRAAQLMFIPLAAGASPIQSGSIALDDTTGFLHTGYGGSSHTHPYFAGTDTGGSSSSGFARFTADGQLVANRMSFDAGTNTIFGITNLAVDETAVLGFDQILLNGNPSRTIGTTMLTMKALNGQSGDFFRANDNTGSALFRVRSDGNLTIRGATYTFPASAGTSGVLTNNGSGTLTWSPAAAGSGALNFVQISNGAGGLTSDGGHTFDPTTAIMSVGKSGLTGALQLIATNGSGVQLKPSATTGGMTLTLFPSLPGSTNFITVDATGQLGLSAGSGSGGGLSDPGANGYPARTALNTTVARTMTAGLGMTITRGDGVGGNTVFDITTTGIASGTYTKLTVDTTGRATAGTNITANDIATPTTQASHGFVNTACGSGGGVCVLRPVYNDTTGAWFSARNDDQTKWATGVVISVTDSSNFILATTPGIYTVTGHGLSTANTYFLADTGGITSTPGTGARQAVLIALDANRIEYFGVMQAAASSGGGGGSTLTIQSAGVTQGTATTLNFTSGTSASVAAGVATISATGGSGGMADPGSNGLMVRTSLNVSTARAIAVGSNLTVTNPDGVSGNPTISLGSQVILQSGSFTANNCPKYNSSGNLVDSGGTCGGGGGGSSVWSSLTGPVANLSLNMSTFSSTFQASTALTATTTRVFTLAHTTSGAVSAGLGVVTGYQIEDSSGLVVDAGEFGARWQNHITTNRVAEFIGRLVYSNGSATQLQDAFVWRPDRLTLLNYDSTSGSTMDLRFRSPNGNDIGFKAPDAPASSLIFTLPSSVPGGLPAVGSSAYALVVGSGNLLGVRQLQNAVSASAPIVFSSDTVSCPSCVTQASNQVTLGAVLFAALGTPANGTFLYCSDCAVTSGADNTAASGGTGAFVVRLNGVWRAFIAQN